MMGEIKFLQARDFRSGRRDPKTGLACPVKNVVVHTAEIGESLQGAEALMRACAAGRPPKPDGSANLASWHYAIDADSITQSVREEDTAFHAPGLSHCSIGLEHSGRAKQTAQDWDDEFSIRTLELSAELVAGICARHDIPIRRLYTADLVAGAAGICGHVDVSEAFKRSHHWDPGPNFPWNHYLERVLYHQRNAPTDPAPPPSWSSSIAPPLDPRALPVLRKGATGDRVRLLQERLSFHRQVPRFVVDGVFGPATEGRVKEFQRAHALTPDGVVGAMTWQELLK